jgi:hypothetical protein
MNENKLELLNLSIYCAERIDETRTITSFLNNIQEFYDYFTNLMELEDE